MSVCVSVWDEDRDRVEERPVYSIQPSYEPSQIDSSCFCAVGHKRRRVLSWHSSAFMWAPHLTIGSRWNLCANIIPFQVPLHSTALSLSLSLSLSFSCLTCHFPSQLDLIQKTSPLEKFLKFCKHFQVSKLKSFYLLQSQNLNQIVQLTKPKKNLKRHRMDTQKIRNRNLAKILINLENIETILVVNLKAFCSFKNF